MPIRRAAFLLIVAVVLTGCCSQVYSDPGGEAAARYFDSVRHDSSALQAFLRAMPKGGDLHNHLSGAVYAETLIDFAAHASAPLCFDQDTQSLVASAGKPCDKKKRQLNPSDAYQMPGLYHDMVDAFSMRDFVPNCEPQGAPSSATLCESAHDHFFATFGKFGAATEGRTGDMMAEAASRAAADHIQYLELMLTEDGKLARNLADSALKNISWEAGFAAPRNKLLAAGLKATVVPATIQRLNDDEARMQQSLACAGAQPDPGCQVEIRSLYQVSRGGPPEQVFAQILLGFELVQADPRFVGLNLVMPEDWYVPMRDFSLHMKMLDYLHGIYPKVHISLHAGELVPGLVPPDGLRFHIRDSVRLGHAERIGHGVDIAFEDGRDQLLKDMAKNRILVEICLTSNDGILGVRGSQHPLKLYLDNNVPVALATDDQGVSRSDMTHEYLRAAQTYDFLSYKDLKRMSRMSLEHSFLPGESLWADADTFRSVNACAEDHAGNPNPSPGCRQFLNGSEHARAQWKLEAEFAAFEKKFK